MQIKDNEIYYNIKSKSSGKVLDIAEQQNKGNLILYYPHNGNNQLFKIVEQDLQINIQCKQDGKFLTVMNGSDKNGAPIRSQPKQLNHPSQQFRIQQTSPNSGQFIIYTFCGKMLDCLEEKTKDGTPIIQWDFHGKSNQKWFMIQK